MARGIIKATVNGVESRVSQKGNEYMLLHFGEGDKRISVSVFGKALISWLKTKGIKAGDRVNCEVDLRPDKFGGVSLVLDSVQMGRKKSAGSLMVAVISGVVEEKGDVKISKTTGNPYVVLQVSPDDARNGEVPLSITAVGEETVKFLETLSAGEEVVIPCKIYPAKYGKGNLSLRTVIRARGTDTAEPVGAKSVDAEHKEPEPEADEVAEPVTTKAEPDEAADDQYGGAVSDADREFLAAMFGDVPSEG